MGQTDDISACTQSVAPFTGVLRTGTRMQKRSESFEQLAYLARGVEWPVLVWGWASATSERRLLQLIANRCQEPRTAERRTVRSLRPRRPPSFTGQTTYPLQTRCNSCSMKELAQGEVENQGVLHSLTPPGRVLWRSVSSLALPFVPL